MPDNIQGAKLDVSGESIKFGITVDGQHHFCLISRAVLNDLSRSHAAGDQKENSEAELMSEFGAFRHVIARKAEEAIRMGMVGDPLLLPGELFFPRGRPLDRLYQED
ncbi:Protein of unknown function [Cupriavidus sp. YR651]|uniref:DUF1488 family protein n=1 Tax=Cupriavidus sp. YR651 TaxID=1855315 RepID=UPI000884EF57|nr:DUF1488 family protein [Cupriavidus sp. YR651]SDD55118.1 Protein of unknown function [Cupriavidus sp. YR651]